MRPGLSDPVGSLITAVGFKMEAFFVSIRNDKLLAWIATQRLQTRYSNAEMIPIPAADPQCFGSASGRCVWDGDDTSELLHAFRNAPKCAVDTPRTQRHSFRCRSRAPGLDCGRVGLRGYASTRILQSISFICVHTSRELPSLYVCAVLRLRARGPISTPRSSAQ